ncbi:fungal-specific transcription factor domain-containing protein [Mycena filopes]|nr:fungal-specific transcription factor domain-containing protein [Mycena filopes]
MSWPPNTPAYTLPYTEFNNDDADQDGDEEPEGGGKGEKTVRRRSSKACDQCRKSKCKCERTTPGEPCRSCVLLGTECTFLGPSRKRGPPKGYIDAIEARLHQTEALVGILLAAARVPPHSTSTSNNASGSNNNDTGAGDERARALLHDLREDPLARAILARVEASPYGPGGRGAANSASVPASAGDDSSGRRSESRTRVGRDASPGGTGPGKGGKKTGVGVGVGQAEVGSAHPSHEWMDRVTMHVLRRAREARSSSSSTSQHLPSSSHDTTNNNNNNINARRRYDSNDSASPSYPPPTGSYQASLPQNINNKPTPQRQPQSGGESGAEGRRLRRRVDSVPSNNTNSGGYQRESNVRGRAGRSGSSSGGSGSEGELDVDRAAPASSSRNQNDVNDNGNERGRGERAPAVVQRQRQRYDPTRAGAERDAGLAGAVGQLSLNEEKQVRYHGKASGLHLLARRKEGENNNEEMDVGKEEREAAQLGDRDRNRDGDADGEVGRNVGGIWRFPPARVWPAVSVGGEDALDGLGVGEGDGDRLPPRGVQEALLARYFAHVHPSFPVVHKRAVMEGWTKGGDSQPPPLLLLAMFALAARYAPQPAPPPDGPRTRSTQRYMWPAGDAFLFRAKALLDSSYASSRASTCQALLLMGFREIGIGAMAQAWIYIGMAVRMAQDLGMQRDADGWVRVGVRVGGAGAGAKGGRNKSKGRSAGGGETDREEEGMAVDGDGDGERPVGGASDGRRAEDGKLFGAWEIAERRRIWYACVIMDKYVSTYIGRPLAIFERDFDTSLPSESDAEEMEEWAPPQDAPVSAAPRPGRVISCFNASARLAGILSQIVQSIYALRPAASRHAELVVLDGQLDKWRLGLPAHLQHDPAYWCAVLLLHRPFIRQNGHGGKGHKHSPAPDEGDVRGSAEKSYELCAGAANHITTIATLYSETYTLKHCAVFLCYYIFTASIMHVTSLSAYPTDPQARMGLTKCMDALKEMEIVWPGAARALDLLRGTQASLSETDSDVSSPASSTSRSARKRSAPNTLDDSDAFAPPAPNVPENSNSNNNNFLLPRPFPPMYAAANGQQPHYGGIEPRSNPAAYYPPPPASAYERWPVEGAGGAMGVGAGALAFQGTLSTAVMGPAYSTGLVDERLRRHEGSASGPQARFGQLATPQQQQQHQQQQYWNEYAGFQPPGYPGLHDPALVAQGEPQIFDFAGMYAPNQHGR